MSSRQLRVCGIEISERHCRLNLLCAVFVNVALDALNFANEGKLVIAVERNAAAALAALIPIHGKDARLLVKWWNVKVFVLPVCTRVKRSLFTTRQPLPRIC